MNTTTLFNYSTTKIVLGLTYEQSVIIPRPKLQHMKPHKDEILIKKTLKQHTNQMSKQARNSMRTFYF